MSVQTYCWCNGGYDQAKAEIAALTEENERLKAMVAELVEALESSQHGLHEECRCGQCKFVRLRDASLDAYRKGDQP